MDPVSRDTVRTEDDLRAGAAVVDPHPSSTADASAVTAQGTHTPPRGDAPAWRAAAVGAAFGLASVVWSLNQHLSEWAAVGGTVGLMALGLLCMVGLRFVVDQERARRNVFYVGEGHAAWFFVNFLGMWQIPGLFVSGIADPTALVLTAAGLGIAVALANQAIVARCMTRKVQPEPEPVPLG